MPQRRITAAEKTNKKSTETTFVDFPNSASQKSLPQMSTGREPRGGGGGAGKRGTGRGRTAGKKAMVFPVVMYDVRVGP